MKLHRFVTKSIFELGNIQHLNLKIRGWINYYGKFRKSELAYVFRVLNNRLVKWARNKYKRFRKSYYRARKWLRKIADSYPYLFVHWTYGWKP